MDKKQVHLLSNGTYNAEEIGELKVVFCTLSGFARVYMCCSFRILLQYGATVMACISRSIEPWGLCTQGGILMMLQHQFALGGELQLCRKVEGIFMPTACMWVKLQHISRFSCCFRFSCHFRIRKYLFYFQFAFLALEKSRMSYEVFPFLDQSADSKMRGLVTA